MFLKTLDAVSPYPEMFALVPQLKQQGYTCTLLSDIFSTDKKYVEQQGRYKDFDDLILSCDV
ncbi:MAG: hypothetical protein GXP45_03135 [bacterium]|nr:hypothetical protein [bacterium]